MISKYTKMGNKETHLTIRNETKNDCSTSVSSCDNYDWGKNEGPHHVFNRVQIKAGQQVSKWLWVKPRANGCPFTMTLTFTNGLKDTFRLNQQYAMYKGSINFSHSHKSHDINWERTGNTIVVTVKNTAQQIENLAKEETKKKQNEEARLRELQAEALYKKGQEKLEEAMKWENECSQTEAKNALSESRLKLIEACKLSKNQEYKKICDFVDFKMQALDSLEAGLKLNEEAHALHEQAQSSKNNNDLLETQAKYKQALEMFNKAVSFFNKAAENNVDKVGDGLAHAKQQVAVISDVISDLNHAELTFEKDKTDEKEQQVEDSIMHQQI